MTPEQKIELQSVIDRVKTGGCSNPETHADIFEEAIEFVKPKNILEIGFFCGNSSLMMLELSKKYNTKVTSVDPFLDNATNDFLHSVGRPEEIGGDSVQLAAVESVRENYGDRFRFIHKRSLNAAIEGDFNNEKYDLCYIDGDHWQAGVTIDLNICLALKIPFILMDDFSNEYPGVGTSFSQLKNRFLPLRMYQDNGAHVLFAANLDVVKLEEKNNV